LSGNSLLEACDKAHRSGNHYAALLAASASGLNSTNGELLMQQLESFQQMRADRFVDPARLRMFALVAGMPEWRGSEDSRNVNVCEGLDWKRAFAAHLWFLTSPVASVGDAFVAYEEAAGVGDDDAMLQVRKTCAVVIAC
jgi:nuclear pore complex protein Nup98-Nup96